MLYGNISESEKSMSSVDEAAPTCYNVRYRQCHMPSQAGIICAWKCRQVEYGSGIADYGGD